MASLSSLKESVTNILTNTKLYIIEEQLNQLIKSNLSSESSLESILLESSNDKRRFTLMKYFIQSFPQDNPPYAFIPLIFDLIELNMNSQSLSDIIELYAEICKWLSKEANQSNISEYINSAFHFCQLNLKSQETINQRIAALCLGQLIYAITLQSSITKAIWRNMMDAIENPSFKAKNELLSTLEVFIERVNKNYSPFATITLYKALDFLSEEDWKIRKLALKVIYNLVYYCNDDIYQLKLQIIEFLEVVKNDSVEEVRNMCGSILDIINKPKAQMQFKPIEIQLETEVKDQKMETFGKEGVLLNQVIVSESNMCTEVKNQTEDSHMPNNITEYNNEKDKGLMVHMTSPLKVSDLKYDRETEDNKPDNKQKDNNEEKKSQTNLINNQPKVKRTLFDKINANTETAPKYSGNNTNNNQYYPNQNNKKNDKEQMISKSQYDNKIGELLKQMKEMSDKQIYLIDIITSLQKTSQEEIGALTSRINSLESFMTCNSNQSKSQGRIKSPKNIVNNPNDILLIALNSSDTELINTISSLSLADMNKIDKVLIEDIISRLINLLVKGNYISPIIHFFKNVLMGINHPLRDFTMNQLGNVLSFILTDKSITIKEQDFIDIKLLQSYIFKKKKHNDHNQ